MVWYRLPKAGLRVRCTRRLGFAKGSHSIRHVLRTHESLRIGIPGMVRSTLPGLACLLYPASVSRHASPSRGSPPLTLPYPSFLLRINGPLLASLLLASIDSHFPIRAPWSCWPGPQSLFPSSPSILLTRVPLFLVWRVHFVAASDAVIPHVP